MRIASELVLPFLCLSGSTALYIHEGLLDKAQELGVVDTFIQFTKMEMKSRKMARLNKILDTRLPSLSAYAGLQEFPGERPIQLTPSQLARGIRRQTVMELLKRHAERTQGPTLRELRELGYEVESYWINNSIRIKNAPFYLLTLIATLAQTEEGQTIEALVPNRVIAKIPPIRKMISKGMYQERILIEHDDKDIPWNIKLINVDKVWAKTKGADVVVANIDTGVDFLHPRLKNQYRGLAKDLKTVSHDYCWYDPEGFAPIPHDCHGHGSHTMGTMVGDGIGIAPEAKWIAAQGCDEEGCSQSRLLSSAQWVMCPTDTDGLNPRCELGADVVNNSWGGEITDEESLTWFTGAVEAWLASGMIPIFAQGNSGPDCGTVGTPGDLESVIGVGAIDQFGSLTVFSSRGPGGNRLGHAKFKPDYVAPGQAIISCKAGGELVAMSGTSMAAPHVAGVAVLLLALKGDLTFDALRVILTETINTASLHEPQMGQLACYGMRWDEFPNYHYGYGLIDAEAAAQRL